MRKKKVALFLAAEGLGTMAAFFGILVTLISVVSLGCSSAPSPFPPVRSVEREYHSQREVNPSQLADESLSTLVPGNIVYNPPNEMRVGDTVPIQVRIATAPTPIPVLTNGLIRGPSTPPEGIRISRTMKVSLKGALDDFKIDLQSPDEQIVEDESPTEWLWMVKALRSGNRVLYLSAIAVVRVGGLEKVKEFPVHAAQIHVKVNPIGFMEENWKEITGALTGTGLLGWVAAWFQKRRRKRRSPSAHA